MANKVKFGLAKTNYSVVTNTNSVITYSVPKPILGAVSLVQNPVGEAVTFYADDTTYYEENTNNGYDGTLEMALIPDEFRVDVFGDELDTNGALIENSTARPKKIALMFEFDGDVNKTRHVNYNVTVARPSIESSTKTNTREVKTETMAISVRPAADTLDVKAKLEQGKTGYETFFTSVYLKNAVINTVILNTLEVSKATATDEVITLVSTDANNTIKNATLDGANIGGINLTAVGLVLTIDGTYLEGLDVGVYTVILELVRGNSISIILTVTV